MSYLENENEKIGEILCTKEYDNFSGRRKCIKNPNLKVCCSCNFVKFVGD